MGIVDDVERSADWIAAALRSSGYDADFSGSSLWEIERFFDDQVPDGRAREGGLLSLDVGPRLFAIGAYVGEVIRRGVGGEWQGDDTDPDVEINVELIVDGASCRPVQRVIKRYRNGREDCVATYGAWLGLDVGQRPERPARRRSRLRR